jgi:hypothetical protein
MAGSRVNTLWSAMAVASMLVRQVFTRPQGCLPWGFAQAIGMGGLQCQPGVARPMRTLFSGAADTAQQRAMASRTGLHLNGAKVAIPSRFVKKCKGSAMERSESTLHPHPPLFRYCLLSGLAGRDRCNGVPGAGADRNTLEVLFTQGCRP